MTQQQTTESIPIEDPQTTEKKSELYNEKKDKLTKETYEISENQGYCLDKNETKAKNRFLNKNIIITGGAGNFGTKCAERFASEGANIILWDIIDPSKVVKHIKDQYKVKVQGYIVDVSQEENVKKVVLDCIKEFQRIDMLFNNAGYQGDFVKTHLYDVEDFRKILDINVTGVFIVLKYVSQAMMHQKPQGGCIVNTASMAAHSGPPNMIAYGSSKAAVLHMTRIAAKDLAPYNIRVNSVSPAFIGPGFMWTRQVELQAKADSQYYDHDPKVVKEQMINSTPLRRYGSIDEVIGPVAFLFSDDASYLTGVDIQITGGMN